jgi:hypothetical protein
MPIRTATTPPTVPTQADPFIIEPSLFAVELAEVLEAVGLVLAVPAVLLEAVEPLLAAPRTPP